MKNNLLPPVCLKLIELQMLQQKRSGVGDTCRHAFILCSFTANSELVDTLLCKNVFYVMIDDVESISISFLSHPVFSLALYSELTGNISSILLYKFSSFQTDVIHYCKVKVMKWNHKFDYVEEVGGERVMDLRACIPLM
jgi:hypothetical protein